MQQNYRILIKKYGALAVVALVVFIGVIWLYSHGSVSYKNTGTETNLQYTITDSDGTVINGSTSGEGSFKKVLASGTYQLLVQQDGKSYFQIVKVGHFLLGKTITSPLAIEKQRIFVGQNPAPCMYYSNQQILYSAGCGADISTLSKHLPATPDMPTNTLTPVKSSLGTTVAATIRVDGKDKIITGNDTQGATDGADPHYVIYDFDSEVSLKNGTRLDDLNNKQSYSAVAYKAGFVVYSSDYSTILYYSSVGAKPETLDLGAVKDKDMKAFDLSVSGDTIALAYGTNSLGSNNGEDQIDSDKKLSSAEKGSVELHTLNGSQKHIYTYKGGPAYAELCTDGYFCLVKDRTLEIYSLQNSKSKLVQKIQGVNKFVITGGSLHLIMDSIALKFDPKTANGSVDYSFGDYTGCGVKPGDDNGYLLCVRNPNNDLSALYIDTKNDNSDNIDKKVLNFYQQPYIDNVSPYRQFIFLSPNLGPQIYDVASKGYIDNPVVRAKVAQDIIKLSQEINIDPTKYTVINIKP